MKKELLNIDTFIDWWFHLEVPKMKMSEKELEQFDYEIADAMNFKEIFEIISTWSHTPYKERINNFLEKNNFTLEDDVLKLLL